MASSAPSRPPRRAARPAAAASLLCLAASAAAACWGAAFVGPATAPFRPRRPAGALTQRRFFNGEYFSPEFWAKQTFLITSLEPMLPNYRPKSKLKVIELEPSDGRTFAYLKTNKKQKEAKANAYYLEEYFGIGETICGMSDDQVKSIGQQVKGAGANFVTNCWKSPRVWGIPDGSIHMGLLAEGAVKRLGGNYETAMNLLYKTLRPEGRVFIVATPEDESAMGGTFDTGMVGSITDRLGFELVAAARDEELKLTVGYMRKKGQGMKLKKGAAGAKKGAARGKKKVAKKASFLEKEEKKRPTVNELMDEIGAFEEDPPEIPKEEKKKDGFGWDFNQIFKS